MRGAPILLLGSLLGCTGSPTPTPATEPPATEPAREPAVTPEVKSAPASPPRVQRETIAVGEQGWTVDNIGELEPVVPTRAAHTPVPMPPDPAWDRTLNRLNMVVDAYTRDPGNPWAIGHGLTALGAGMTMQDGTPAIDYLFAHYAREFKAGDTVLVYFPTGTDKNRIEPHTDQMLKVFTEIGVDPNRVVQVEGHPHLVADLYRGAVIRSYLVPQKNHASYHSTNDMPWSLQGISAWAGGRDLTWTAADGSRTELDFFTDFTVHVLDQETAFMADAMKAGADFEKKGQGIFTYTCGGAHLLQGAAWAVAQGHGSIHDREKIQAQVPLMFYRLPRELKVYDATLQGHPEGRVRLLGQRLKFTGHYLETMHKLAALGFYTPDKEQQALLQGAAQQIALTVEALTADGVYNSLPALRQQDFQLYLDLVGDSCHAMRALDLALGDGVVRY